MALDTAWRRGFLCRFLVVVAASASDQRAWREEHAILAAELAPDLLLGLRLAPGLAEEGSLSSDSLADVQLIEEVLEEMTRDGATDWWTAQALSDSPGWARLRELAGRVLVREGRPVRASGTCGCCRGRTGSDDGPGRRGV